MINSFENVKLVQKNQPFHLVDEMDTSQINFDQIPLLPNQIAYKLDCRSADLVDIKGNTKALFDIKDLSCIDQIYERIQDDNVERFVSEVEDIFSFMLSDPPRTKPYRNVFSTIYTIHNGKKYAHYLRQTFTVQSDSNGVILETGGIYTTLPTDFYKIEPTVIGEDAVHFKAPILLDFVTIFSIRELQILKLISQGYSAQHIADKLFISKLTVDTHRKNMIKKLEVNNTPHLVGLSKDIGLI